jgi:hypothetical protein
LWQKKTTVERQEDPTYEDPAEGGFLTEDEGDELDLHEFLVLAILGLLRLASPAWWLLRYLWPYAGVVVGDRLVIDFWQGQPFLAKKACFFGGCAPACQRLQR